MRHGKARVLKISRWRARQAFIAERREHPLQIVHPPSPPDAGCSEAAFQRMIVNFAMECGWRHWHDNYALRNDPGFPDLVLVRPPVVLFIEAKTTRGRVREEQRWWEDDLLACPGVLYRLWRPEDWPEILHTLMPD